MLLKKEQRKGFEEFKKLEEGVTLLQARVRGFQLRKIKRGFESLKGKIEVPTESQDFLNLKREVDDLSSDLNRASLEEARSSVDSFMGLSREKDKRKKTYIERLEREKAELEILNKKYLERIIRFKKEFEELEKRFEEREKKEVSPKGGGVGREQGLETKESKFQAVDSKYKFKNAKVIEKKAEEYGLVKVFRDRLTAIRKNPENPGVGRHKATKGTASDGSFVYSIRLGKSYRLLYSVDRIKRLIVLLELLDHDKYDKRYGDTWGEG